MCLIPSKDVDEMRRYRLPEIITIILLISSVLCICPAIAENTPDSQVETTMTCTFDTGSHLTVHAQMIVNRIDNIYDKSYNRQTIESISTSDLEVMGIIKQRLRDAAKHQIETAFSDAEISAVNRPSYIKPYFIDDFQVNLTTAFFHYNGSLNLTNFINGVLDMGANVTYHFHLQAEQGWNTTYTYVLPSKMTLVYANTSETNLNSNTITWTIQNWIGGDTGKEATLSIRSKNPTSPASESEDISLEFTLDTRTVSSISFMNSIVMKRLNIRNYDALPGFVTGIGVIPADGVRLFIHSGLFSWADLFEKTIQPIERQITPIIENSSFAQPLSYSFTWDAESTTNCSTPFNITHMDDSPSLKVNYKDADVNLQICQLPARVFIGLMNAGAAATITADDVNFGSGLSSIPYSYTSILRLPTNITLDGESAYQWNKTTPINGSFHSDLQPTPPYTQEHTETRIEIELSKMDLNIPSIFTGKTELTASTKLKEDDRLYVTRWPSDLSLPSKVHISFMNSDALRLCLEENVFSENETSLFLTEKTASFQQRLSAILHGLNVKGTFDRKVFSNSLIWDGDISAMDGVVPVVVSNTANEAYTVRFNVSLWPVDLKLTPQNFTLKGIENQTVTYRIIFPQGITINASDTLGKSIITGKTNDGRDYAELSFDPESASQSTVLTCVLNVSPVYVVWIFMPCILVFILLIVLIVIIILIRKKRGGLRRGKRKLFEPEDNEPSEYGGEEYYVPPPPHSSKKKK
jgi:hypothetical protein